MDKNDKFWSLHLMVVLVALCVGLGIGIVTGEKIAEQRFLKQALITPPAEWTERHGDSLRTRQVWNTAAMANDLKILQAEQKKIVE